MHTKSNSPYQFKCPMKASVLPTHLLPLSSEVVVVFQHLKMGQMLSITAKIMTAFFQEIPPLQNYTSWLFLERSSPYSLGTKDIALWIPLLPLRYHYKEACMYTGIYVGPRNIKISNSACTGSVCLKMQCIQHSVQNLGLAGDQYHYGWLLSSFLSFNISFYISFMIS